MTKIKQVNLDNGWFVLCCVAAFGVIISFISYWSLDQGNPLAIVISWFAFYCLILGFIGGWLWLPIICFQEYKAGKW